jgi:hypothetical protein
MSAKINTINPYHTFILKSNYHEGKFIIFEENRYWYGHINALHVSHELSKKLLGLKLNDHIVADLGLDIYDAYEVTQIALAPVYRSSPGILIGSNQNLTHRDRTLDGARGSMFISGVEPDKTLASIYSEIRQDISNIQLRDLRIPIVKVPILKNTHSNLSANLQSSKPMTIDEELSRAINLLEITEYKLGIAIRGRDLFSITIALTDAERVIHQIKENYQETDRFKSLLGRCKEAKNLIEPGIN